MKHKKRCLKIADRLACDEAQHAVMVRSINTFTEEEAEIIANDFEEALDLARDFADELQQRNKRKRKNGTKSKTEKTP